MTTDLKVLFQFHCWRFALLLIISLVAAPYNIDAAISSSTVQSNLKINKTIPKQPGDTVHILSLSQDKSFFYPAVVQTNQGVKFLDERGRTRTFFPISQRMQGDVTPSANNKYVVLRTDGKIYMYGIDGSLLWSERSDYSSGPVYPSPNGRYVVFLDSDEGEPSIFPPIFVNANGKIYNNVYQNPPLRDKGVRELIERGEGGDRLAFSPDGTLVANHLYYRVGPDERKSLLVVMNENRHIVFCEYLEPFWIDQIEISPDGQHIIVEETDDKKIEKVIELIDLQSGQRLWKISFPIPVIAQTVIGFMSDSTSSIIVTDQVRLYETKSGVLTQTIPLQSQPDKNISINSHGNLIRIYGIDANNMKFLEIIDTIGQKHGFYQGPLESISAVNGLTGISFPNGVITLELQQTP